MRWGLFFLLFPLFLIAELNDPGSSDCMCTLPMGFSSKVPDVFPLSLEEMTIGVNCGPVAYSKLLKAEASFRETQQNFDIRRRPWQTVVVR